jgi:hypothetical protein
MTTWTSSKMGSHMTYALVVFNLCRRHTMRAAGEPATGVSPSAVDAAIPNVVNLETSATPPPTLAAPG